MKNFSTKISLLLLLALLTVVGCQKEDNTSDVVTADKYSREVATKWFEQLRTLTKKTAGFTPPVASRAFGYAGVALWESVAPGIPDGKSLVNQLSGLQTLPEVETGKTYHWAACANAAMGYMARNLYATAPTDQISAVQDLEDDLKQKYALDTPADVLDRSEKFGQAIAAAIFEWSKTDGGHEGYSKNFPASYTPPTGPGFWVPTAPGFQKALQPYWGNNREFVPASILNSQPVGPKTYSVSKTSLFYAQALEVYSVTTNLTIGQKKIAQYWSDDPGNPGTPPGHSISIATQVLDLEDVKLDVAAEAYCKVGLSVADAFISCWKCKYDHNLLRPITYLQQEIDPTWTPLLGTPPFPEYTSGHSVQSGASFQVMSDLFGYNYKFTDQTHKDRTDIDGSPRTFNSFFDAANEAAISRLYGGIHYRDAIELGVEQGKIIGRMITALNFRD